MIVSFATWDLSSLYIGCSTSLLTRTPRCCGHNNSLKPGSWSLGTCCRVTWVWLKECQNSGAQNAVDKHPHVIHVNKWLVCSFSRCLLGLTRVRVLWPTFPTSACSQKMCNSTTFMYVSVLELDHHSKDTFLGSSVILRSPFLIHWFLSFRLKHFAVYLSLCFFRVIYYNMCLRRLFPPTNLGIAVHFWTHFLMFFGEIVCCEQMKLSSERLLCRPWHTGLVTCESHCGVGARSLFSSLFIVRS